MRRISRCTRDDRLKAVAQRYHSSTRAEKCLILTEFAEIFGYHRKHAERLRRCEDVAVRSRPRPERRDYAVVVREALVLLGETSERLCGNRRKPLFPLLIPAMERRSEGAAPADQRNHDRVVILASV